MAEHTQIPFRKSWDIERIGRLYRAVSDVLERVETGLSLGDYQPKDRVCLAVIEEDLRAVCFELEQHLLEQDTIPEELFARSVCVLEEAVAFNLVGQALP